MSEFVGVLSNQYFVNVWEMDARLAPLNDCLSRGVIFSFHTVTNMCDSLISH